MLAIGLDHGNGNVNGKSDFGELNRPSYFAFAEDCEDDSTFENGSHNLNLFESTKFEREFYKWGNDIRNIKKVLSSYGLENRYNQKTYRLLSEFALSELLPPSGQPTSSVFLVTGCPSKELGTSLENELKQVYHGGHIVNFNDTAKIYNVTSTIILPQPLGTVLYHYLDDEGYTDDDDYRTLYAGVIDIGQGSTDLDGMKALRRQKDDTDTISLGMFDAHKEIADYINKETPAAKATPQEVERQILSGSDSYEISQRSRVDIKMIKDKSFSKLAYNIINKINERWTNRSKFDKLLLTGGGAMALSHHLQEWEKDIIVTENSQMANAIGFYRYAKSKILKSVG